MNKDEYEKVFFYIKQFIKDVITHISYKSNNKKCKPINEDIKIVFFK